MLGFGRTLDKIKEFSIDLGEIKVIDLLSYKDHLSYVYHSKFIISDSGSDQEQSALLKTPVIVPRNHTERPESVVKNCSFMVNVDTANHETWDKSLIWKIFRTNPKTKWLGDGSTSQKIIDILKEVL